MAHDLIFGKTSRQFNRDSSMGDDPLVWTPSAVRAEFGRIRNVLDTVNTEASQAVKDKKLQPAEWDRWFSFYNTAHKYVGKASAYWGSNVVVARSYETEALKWHELIAKRGGSTLGPEMEKPAGLFGKLGFNFPTLLLATGGALATGYLINSIRRK